MSQMEKQDITSAKDLNEMDISNPPDKRVQSKGHKDAHGTQEKNG